MNPEVSAQTPESSEPALIDRFGGEVVLLAVAAVLTWQWPSFANGVLPCLRDPLFRALPDLVPDGREALYGSLAGVNAGLLGFILAALTILLGHVHSDRFAVVRTSSRLTTLIFVYLAGIRSHAVALGLCLVAIFVDQAGHSGNVTVALVLCASAIALLRLLRVLWITEKVAFLLVGRNERQPGQPR